MKLISFYPGPSRVYSGVTEYLYEAYMEGVLSFNHRSPQFMELLENTLALLKEKLDIPQDYEIVFTSSATECWEIIAQSLTKEKSFHFYNGAFGEKWMNYAEKIKSGVSGIEFNIEEELPVDTSIPEGTEIICLTQNETGNGTQVSNELIKNLKEKNPDQLLAVDATSSMAGLYLDFQNADIWFASVQKCFGLPAGMGVMILSPRAVKYADEIGENDHYNSLTFILENFRKHQTPYTPNVMDIYLLYRTLDVSQGIRHLDEKLKIRRTEYEKLFEDHEDFNFLVKNPAVRSDTVLAMTHPNVEEVKSKALDSSILLGSGYGEWKKDSFRIANFPAIKKREIVKLKNFLSAHYGFR